MHEVNERRRTAGRGAAHGTAAGRRRCGSRSIGVVKESTMQPAYS
eukprot:COSAG01_NODE_63551_length_279_cov_1.155556_1_plen_44_part_01